MKKRTAKILKWTGVAALVLAVIYVILSVAATISLKRAYAALEADGRPTKEEEIIPRKIPDEDNAALVYEAVVLKLKSEPAGKQDLFSQLGDVAGRMLKETPDAETVAEFRQLSEREIVADALVALEKGSRKPGYWIDRDYSLGPGLTMPNLMDMIRLTRFLCATARLQMADGDHETAWQTTLTALRMANAPADEPLLLSQLIRATFFGMTTNTIHKLEFEPGPSARQYREIEALLREFEDPAPFAAAMDGERLLIGEWAFNLSWFEFRSCRDEFELKGQGGEGVGFGAVLNLEFLFPPMKRRDHAAYISVMHTLARNMTEPYSPEDATVAEQLKGEIPRYCILTRMTTTPVTWIKPRMVSVIARARVTRAGLALIRHRRDTGAWPPDLKALNEDGLLDPFTGKPLIYRRNPDGFTLYSVGRNLVDEQGANDKPDKPDNNGRDDIAWRYLEADKQIRSN